MDLRQKQQLFLIQH